MCLDKPTLYVLTVILMLHKCFLTYKGHESEPCVPLYTEPTDIATEGKGRATVEEVYQQSHFGS
ncbi:hypothetical protein NXW27_21045, partial [Phocaeicola dorei]|nr:hypothetical protein [Phocaeicola dorei]